MPCGTGAEPGGGAEHELSGKLLQLLKNWPASAALSWGNLRGFSGCTAARSGRCDCGPVHIQLQRRASRRMQRGDDDQNAAEKQCILTGVACLFLIPTVSYCRPAS